MQVLDSAISGVAAEVSHPLSKIRDVITIILSGKNTALAMRRPWAWKLDPELESEDEARQEPEGEEEADKAEAPMPSLVPTEETEAVEAEGPKAEEAGDIETRNIVTRTIDTWDTETRDTKTRNIDASGAGEIEVSEAREEATPFAFTAEQPEVIRTIEAAPDNPPPDQNHSKHTEIQ